MILPKNIKSKHKLRDAEICLMWERDDKDTNVIAEKFKLTQRRIEQILRENHAFVKIDKEWEKRKRIHRLRIEIKNKPKSFKDVADLLEQLKDEIEGDTPLFQQTNQTIVVKIEKADPIGNQIQTTREAITNL